MSDQLTPAAIDEFDGFLHDSDLADANTSVHYEQLTGGVSSDIWRADLGGRQICIKRALAKLKVKDDWFAPVSRNSTEALWLKTAGDIIPGSAPELLAHDPELGMLAMAYLPPEHATTWKEHLRDGDVNLAFTERAAETLAAIHSGSAERPELADSFRTDDAFHAIRLEPYLEATARRHPDLAVILHELVTTTANTREALVHGDVSPKNILVAGERPVFIDAECAWWGDPAFDLAFCLNHFLLKCLWVPECTDDYLSAFQRFTSTYLSAMPQSVSTGIECRATQLLPGLFLARVDGKSPVEYITRDTDKDLVRNTATSLLQQPAAALSAICTEWSARLGEHT